MGGPRVDFTSGPVCGGEPEPNQCLAESPEIFSGAELVCSDEALGGASASTDGFFGGFGGMPMAMLPANLAFPMAQLLAAIPPTPPQPLAVTSPNCLGDTVSSLQQLIQTIQSNPEGFVQDQIIPQLVDHGRYEIQFEAPMVPGTYRGGVVVEGPTWLHTRLTLEDGRLGGTIDFYPGVIKQNAIIPGVWGDATLSQVRIVTDPETNEIRFVATATFLNIQQDATADLTEILLGRRMDSVSGPASNLLWMIAEHAKTTPPEQMINPVAARFRIDVNRRPGDPELPGLGDVSRARFHLDRLEVAPELALTGIDAGVEVTPNLETGGFRVVVPHAEIGEIRHDPELMCGGELNPGSTLSRLRVEDLTLELAPKDRSNLLAGFYPQSGGGRLLFGGGDINGDVVLGSIEGENAIVFTLTGDASGNLQATLDAPRIGIDRAAVILSGGMLQGQRVEVTAGEAILQSLQATIDFTDGELSYNAQVTPSLASLTLDQRNPDGTLLAGASILGFSCQPVALSGNLRSDGIGEHQVVISDCDLAPSEARWTEALGLGGSGTARFGFEDLQLGASFSPTGLDVDRFVLPRYFLSSESTVSGNTITASVTNREAADPLASGLGLVRDETGTTAGITHTAFVNTRAENLRFTTPQGTFEMTGDLSGTIGVIDLAEPASDRFTPPNFRPVAGRVNLILNGTVRQVSGGNARLSGRIVISDDTSGRLTLSARSRVSGPVSARSRAEIGADLADLIETVTPGPGIEVPYYDFDPAEDQTIPIPRILLEAVIPPLSPIRATGDAQVTRLGDGTVNASYRLRIPLPSQEIPISGGTLRINAGHGSTRGRVRISGENENARIRIRPPESFEVQMTQERDGITYEISGLLTPTGEIRAALNLANPLQPSLRLAEPPDPYTVTGSLTVTARNETGEVIASGEVGLTTSYQVTGGMEEGQARFVLEVPETVLTGTLTHGFSAQGITVADGAQINVPIRGLRGEINVDVRNLADPRLTSTWALPSVGSGDEAPEIFIPRVDIAGFEGDQGQFRDLSVNFYQDPNGQQVTVSADRQHGIRFETLPGLDGNPRTVRLTFGVDEARDRVVIEGTSDSSAQVSGSVSPTGEIVVNVTNLRVDTRVNGEVVQPLQLNLNALNTLAMIPGLQVRYNPSTNQIRLTASAPQPTLPASPATFEEFFSWTSDQWTAYRQALEAETHMVRLSEANAAVQRALGKSIPPGRGEIFVNLTSPLDVTLTVDGSLASNLGAAVAPLLDVRRALPAPPPCLSGTCPPVILYDGQNPEGDLYFIQSARGGGQPTIHSEIPGILQEAMGVERTEVDRYLLDLRIALPDLIHRMRQSGHVADHYTEDDLRDLLESYLDSPVAGGTFRQMELRGLITLANVRRSLDNLLNVQGGLLPVHGHVFRNDDYHAVSEGDGIDMQNLALLPVSPDDLQGLIANMADAGRWDHWVDEVSASGGQASGRLLNNYHYTVTVETAEEGNVRLIHFHLTPDSGGEMQAYTRTVRLLPASNVVDPSTGAVVPSGTLVLFDEHSDFQGADHELPFPRTRIPVGVRITWEAFLNGTLRALQPPRTSVTRHATNRFAVTMHNLLALARNPEMTARELRRSLTYDSTRANQTSTVRRIDFLSLNEAGDTLLISATAQDADVRTYLTEQLGIEGAQLERWLRPGTDGTRQIPMEELRTASGLNGQLTAPALRALARTILNPPPALSDIASNFGSATERFIRILGHLKARGQAIRTGLVSDVLLFEDDRFHPNISQASRRQGDTVDTLNIYYIPKTLDWKGQGMSLDVDRFIETINHAEYYSRIDPDNFRVSEVVTNPVGITVDPNRIYTRSQIGLPGGLELNYLISSTSQPVVVEEAGRMSAWRLEPSTEWSDFLDNTGWWLVIPAEGGGHWFFRAGILNSSPSGSDNTGTVAETGRAGVINFGEALITSTLEHQRSGNPTAWRPDQGRAIDFRTGNVIRISQ